MNFYGYVWDNSPRLIDSDGRTPVDWGPWGKFFNRAYWAQQLANASEWVVCSIYCPLCRGFEARPALDQAQGNPQGFMESTFNQQQEMGTSDAEVNQYRTCTHDDPNCTKCLICLAGNGVTKP
jgi:hypothetical protein